MFGRLLRAQQPVGGMYEAVNETLVRQFRMPGYPLVLITTDLLQEGEDLHTFCSTVYHYGISWMPSSMEQRVGRVDRVSSQTDRRLTAMNDPQGDDLLQVYYPHLAETVEVLQVQRVVERLNRFMRIMHENLGGQEVEQRTVDLDTEIVRVQRDLEPLREPLQSAFPVQPSTLLAPDHALAVTAETCYALGRRFLALRQITDVGAIQWEDNAAAHALFGTIQLRTRVQPFTLLLRSVNGRPALRCISPIGMLPEIGEEEERIRAAMNRSGVRVGAVSEFDSYNLTIEGDVLLGKETDDAERVRWLLDRVTHVADRLEAGLLDRDLPMQEFKQDLELEVAVER